MSESKVNGHGAPHPVSGQPHLVPYEADPVDVTRIAMPLALLERRLAAMPAKDVVLIVDACFSGQGHRSLAVPGARPLVFVEPAAQVPCRPSCRLHAGHPVVADPHRRRPVDAVRAPTSARERRAAARDLRPDDRHRPLPRRTARRRRRGRRDPRRSWLTPRVQSAARNRGAAQTPSFTIDPRGPPRDDVVLGWGYPVL